ncbi:MAG: GWxTD domain-containing protein, partial [Calditrichaeota bacterium]
MVTRLEITQTALRSCIGGNWYWVRLICLILTVLVLIRRGNAQETPEELFQQALDFYAQKLYDEAEDRLQKLKVEVPEFYDKEHGSVWYLLGRVMFDKHAPEQAFQIWRLGWQWLKAARRFDPFLLNDFVHQAVIAEEPKYYKDITLAYYELLEKLNPVQHGTFLWRIYDECEFILPENLKQKFESAMQSQNQNLRPATLLKQFWRKQDLTPATLLNERLLEHLQRIEYARRHFPYSNRRGFDERGKIYVQFGQPTAKASAGTVGLDSSRENPVLYVFHPHEVWSYRFLGRHIFFPFVNFEDGRGFVLVDRIDKAIPLHFTESTRSQKGATSRIDVRIYFYNQLARSNPIFYRWVKELDEVRGDQLLANTTFMGGRTPARIRDVRAIYSTA